MLIDCDSCAARTIACGDCVVAFMLGDRADPIELDSAEESALGAFAQGGLLPPLRLVPTYPSESGQRSHRPDPRPYEDAASSSDKANDGRTAIA